MLRPFRPSARPTRKIGEGNFDTRAHVRGNDELAHLARDFNAMAARLTEYRKSSLGDLLQAHLSMQAAIDSLPDPVAIFNIDGNLQNVNRAAETLHWSENRQRRERAFQNRRCCDTSRARTHAQSRPIGERRV